MDLRRKTSISEVEDIQIDRYWVPITPAKTAVPKPQPIYVNKQENQLNQGNSLQTERISRENELREEDCLESESPSGFSRQSGANRVVACSDSTNGVNVTSGFENWGAGLAAKPQIFDGNAGVYDEFSGYSLERWNNLPFADLLALADANRTQQGNVSTSHCVRDLPQYGSSIPTQVTYDLNSPPGTTRDTGITRQFAPVTPDQAKRAENKLVSDLQNTSANEITIQTSDRLDNEVANTRVEVSEIPREKEQPPLLEESSCAAVSTQLEENHNPDNGGEQGIDLNKTPDQKPRRRKHRPKVVIEGQPKRTRKPRTPKAAVPNEHPTGKRKYVRKKGLEKSSTPSVGGTSGTAEPKIAENMEKSCRRSLNFDFETQGGNTEPKIVENTENSYRRSLDFEFETYVREERSNLNSESQAQNFCTGVQSKPTVQLGQGIEVTVEKTKMGIAYDLTRSMNKVLEGYMSMPERQNPTPSTPTKADPPREKLKDDLTNELTRGKCRIVFSNETHDKQEHIMQGSPNDSNCSSSACLTNGEQSRGQKRAHSCMFDEAQLSSMNATGINYNALQAYLMIPSIEHNNRLHSMHFPAIFKRKKTEKGQNSATSSTVSTTTAENSMRQSTMCHQNNACTNSFTSKTEWTPTKVAAINSTQNKQKALEYMMAMSHTEKLIKKRSKGPTRVSDLASRVGTVEYKQWPNFTAIGAPASSNIQGFEASRQPHRCMEAQVAETRPTMATKRRRNSHGSSVPSGTHNRHQSFSKSKGALSCAISRNMSPIDAIVEYLKQLDINGSSKEVAYQEQNALVPYNRRYKEQNALVLYRMDGTVVPFEGSLKKRRPRAKVDLDDETNRVWKLLLENINSEGIDGTDEQKARWWEEERKVFHGRADSFIARMHLVQGDRRFSQWKGSVVDSVVGVFLTQNVSDHLSSSAFMSLAARFPLKSKSSHISCSEDRNGILVEEPDICILEPEDTIKWHEEKLKHPVCDQSSMTLHGVAYNEEKVVNSNETFGSNTGGVRSTNNSRCEVLDSSGNENIIEDERELDSPQNSIVSSQNSVDSSTVPPAEGIGSCSQSNSEDLTAGPSTKRLDGSTSFMELLKMAGTTMGQRVYNHVTGNVSLYKDGHNQAKSKGCGVECIHSEDVRFSELAKKKEENYTSEHSGLTTESINQPKVQETLTVSFEERPPSFNNVQREVNKLIQSQSMPAEKPKNNNESQTQEHSSQMQKVTLSNVDNSKGKKGRMGKEKQNNVEWDILRKNAQANGKKRERTANTLDSVDWEAVRCADVNEIANAIRERGMNNMLAERIQDFLNRIVREHGSIDLEWLRDVPPDKAKEYLLSIRGLGLKSVECVRLLTLHHLAFPVDTNVGRIAVRLGWVPLQPLPESLQLHLLELYPVLESIQRYLWPRLCKLDQRTLYELHYQMITFGKVFCTKSKPNCNSCPMRGECRHFASAFASARLALPGPEEKSIVCAPEHKAANQNPVGIINPLQLQLPLPQANQQPKALCQIKNREPIIEEPASPEPIIEEPATPEPEHTQIVESNIEDIGCEDPEEIPTIRLNIKEFTQNLQNYMQHNMELQEGDVSKALVALTPEAASLPMPKLKNMSRLRTEHQVYELPDSHPLLEGLNRREPDDPCSYLLAIWTPGETATSIQPPEGRCSSQDFGKLCDQHTCFSCNSIREANSQTVRGTLLIPCRTAMRGSFPLNGTYFQVNEVFADHDSSINPIDVPRAWIWNLPRRTVYFGTSIPTIFKGLSTEGIQYCFWRGFVCVRGFDQKTRAPRPLLARLHFPASKLTKTKGKTDDK